MPDWAVGAARDLPINTERSWDGDAARQRIFEWAGWDDDPQPSRARRAFLAYDRERAENKGSYRLPFADVIDGRLVALASGLRAAASRLPQTDIPDDVRDRARAVLDAYFARLDEDDDDEDRAQPTVFGHPAGVRVVRAADAEELLTIAKRRHALDPESLDDASPFFFQAEISNNRLDAYFTRMHASSLRNYAAEAEAGVAFQNSHRWFQLPFGRSLTGRFVGAGGNGVAKVLADFYTIPGLQLSDVRTDDLILGIRSGIVRDVSIGFYGGTFRCSLCGLSIFNLDCPHIPGVEYERSEGGSERELAVAWVEDAHLSEVSAVYDGATPGAAILKARQEADAGRLRPQIARLLEARYRIKLPGAQRAWAGFTPSDEERAMSEQQQPTRAPEAEATQNRGAEPPGPPPAAPEPSITLASLRSALTEAGMAPAEGWDGDALATIRQAGEELRRLRPLADEGRQYRQDLIAEALAEGVRAYGNSFAQDSYRAILEHAPLETVKRMRDDWRLVADKLLAGGRQSVDQGDEPPGKTARTAAPDEAFRA